MSRPTQKESKYKELDSIMIRLDPISKCIDYQYTHIPEKLQWAGISKHKKMRDIAAKLFFYSDTMLRTFDKNYKPYDGEYAEYVAELDKDVDEDSNPDKNKTSDYKPEKSGSIVGMCLTNLDAFRSSEYCPDDFIMRRISKLIAMWMHERYDSRSDINQPTIQVYNGSQINRTINQMIIACGYYYHIGQFDQFEADMSAWLVELAKTRSAYEVSIDVYRLYQNALQSPLDYIYPETFYIERNIKSVLYNKSVCPRYFDTVKNVFINQDEAEAIIAKSFKITKLGGK